MEVVLYSSGCPKCEQLEARLAQKGIGFKIDGNLEEVGKMGFMFAPVLKVDNKYMTYEEAVVWLRGM